MYFTVSMLKPRVGTVETISFSCIRSIWIIQYIVKIQRIVVFPALSRPRTRILTSLFPKYWLNSFEKRIPIDKFTENCYLLWSMKSVWFLSFFIIAWKKTLYPSVIVDGVIIVPWFVAVIADTGITMIGILELFFL